MYRDSGPAECSSAPRWRLFLGFWPQPPVLAGLLQHARAWQWPPQARRTAGERMHLTLHFLGDVEEARVDALRALDLRWPGCTLVLDQAQLFSGGVAVLEAGEVPPALEALHARSAAALQALGIALETRRWRPHVTLARKAAGARPPAAMQPLAWPMQPRCLLVRSLPAGQGYLPIQVFG